VLLVFAQLIFDSEMTMIITTHRLACWISLILLSCLLFTSFSAHAVYKCMHHGEVIYTDQACDGGQLSLPESPTSESHSNNQNDSLAKDHAEIVRLQKFREQRERQDQQIRDLSARGAAAREHKCKTLALQVRWREEDLKDAPLHTQHKARTRVRRASEKYAMECQR
jgi:hypothetical protein